MSFLPVIWKGYDFDYMSAIELFKHQLNRTADFLESDSAYGLNSKKDASKIRTAIRLMDKVYDEEYLNEWTKDIKAKYGDDILDLEPMDSSKPYSGFLECKYDNHPDSEKIKKEISSQLMKSLDKHNRANRILWKYIGHNIQNWWD